MTSEPRRDGDEKLWILLIVVAGAVLRLYRLASLTWEEDELYTLRDARDLGAQAASWGAPGIAGRPLYYLLQHLLLDLFPATPFYLRLPAVLFGIAGIWATWRLGRRVFGSRAGLLAAALVATSPWHLYASQFARYWSLVYLLATLALGALVTAIDRDSPRLYVRAAAVLVLGMLTHPTFLFPLAGVLVALHVVNRDGSIGLFRPTGRAVRWLWLPWVGAAVAAYVALQLIGRTEALQNASTRGVLASIRLIPAMIQWAGVPIVASAAAAIGYLATSERVDGRRWAVTATLGTLSAFVLLFVASFRTGVYADYGIAALPLLFTATGGAVDRVADRLGAVGSRFALAVGVALVGSMAPETVSHLSDGSRFDYRPAFDMIRALGPDRPVLGHIDAVAKADAPDLDYGSMRRRGALGREPGHWLITSIRRFGLREGRERLQTWIDLNCRRVGVFQRPRFDYRDYRVELHWCGKEPIPRPAHDATP